MRRSMISVALAAGALLGVSAPALAQQAAAGSPAELTCADLEGLTPAHAAALVYYVAGYVEGERSADAAPATGSAASPGNAVDASAPAMPEGTAPAVGGLTLSAQAVLTACDANADALLANLIADQAMDAGRQTDTTGAAPANGMAAPPAGGTSAPANTMAPANEAAPANSAAPAEPAPTNTTAPAPASTPPANDAAPTNAMGAPAASGTAPANSAQ